MHTIDIAIMGSARGTWLPAIERGETVTVVDGDRVVAEIVPAAPASRETEDELRARLVREGLARAPLTPPGTPPPPRLAATMTMDEMLRDLDESRADR